MTSRNQPHYLTSLCLTTNHISASHPASNTSKQVIHITTMERLKACSLKKLGFGIAAVGSLLRILKANSFFHL